MRFLIKWYDKVLGWSQHPHAVRYLGFLSFIDASLFPISPNFMLIPMAYARPKSAFWFAAICTVASILGGILGYALGLFAFEALINPFLEWMGYMGQYQAALLWFQKWGFWAILLACFSPFIPYKIFTIGAGVLQLNLGLFLMASTLGRALRFYMISAVIRFGGPKIEPYVRQTLLRFSYVSDKKM